MSAVFVCHHFSKTSYVRLFLLQYLSKIKVLQLERDRGEWDGLAPDTRREKESSLQMFGQLGRFHNIMSNETIGTLAFLTSGQAGKICLFILMNSFNVLFFYFNNFPHFQRSRGSSYTPSWLRGSSLC